MIQLKHRATGEVILRTPRDYWLDSDLTCQDLSMADFSGQCLEDVNFRRTNLTGANFAGAKLSGAVFRSAILANSVFRNVAAGGSDFEGADLHGADFSDANLQGAVFLFANLSSANLSQTKLKWAKFRDANLTGTVLDPGNMPNQGIVGQKFPHRFGKASDGFRWGYRLKRDVLNEPNVFHVGRSYTSHVFSTCSTEDHPGLEVLPNSATLENYVWLHERFTGLKETIIKVKFAVEDLHRAGDKYRVRKFTVVEEIER